MHNDPDDYLMDQLWYRDVFEACLFSRNIQNRLSNIDKLKGMKPQDPKSQADVQYCYAMGEFLTGNRAMAMAPLMKAVQIFPDHFASIEQLATQHFHEHNFDEAISFYDRAITLNPLDGRNMLNRKAECLRLVDPNSDCSK